MVINLMSLFNTIGLIPSTEISLFTYPPHMSYYDYFDPGFTADVYPTFDSQELEEQATALCKGDKFCLYDVAVMGQLEAGNLTKITSQRRMELIDLSRPSKTKKKKKMPVQTPRLYIPIRVYTLYYDYHHLVQLFVILLVKTGRVCKTTLVTVVLGTADQPAILRVSLAIVTLKKQLLEN